jgi:hypothetical protein
MALTISLPPDAEEDLRKRARAAGQDITGYVEQMVIRELASPLSIVEAAEPLARAVDAAHISEDEFKSVLMDVQDHARRDRRREPA